MVSRAEKKAVKKAKRANESRARKWTRRSFIGAGAVAGIGVGGALMVGIAIRPGDRTDELAKFVTEGQEQLITTWVKIAPDNTVTAIIPHGEMGQGVHTALSAMLAEEMEADWDAMDIMEAPAEKDFANFELGREFLTGGANIPSPLFDTVNGLMLTAAKSMDLQITGGSTSVRFTGVAAMLTAGAAARELLLEAAAQQWDVPLGELRAEKSYIYHGDKKAPFAEFAEVAATLKPNLQPKLKKRSDYKLLGQSLPRVDIPAKVDGTAMFGIDAQVEGIKYGTVMAAPVHGQKIAKLDSKDAKAMPGVIGVYNMSDYVAVVAEGYWQAKQALDMVEVEWTVSGTENVNEESIFAQYAQSLDGGKKKVLHKAGNVTKGLKSAASVYEAEYRVPYLAHACMEPMNATAWVRDGKCDLWTGTQNPLGTRMVTAETLGMDPENVTVHTAFMGGGFGRRATPDYTNQAVMVAKKAGVPVKLIWSREESTQQDHYRPSVLGRFKAGLDEDGMPISWESDFVHKMDPPEASAVFYDIPNVRAQYADSPTHIRLGPWRSVDHTQHGYFTESFIDELAVNAGIDGYEYRRKLLKNKPRHLKVLDTAAKMAEWGKALPAGQAQGISICESFMTIVAEVVTIDMSQGEPRVLHVACAADAGLAVNPDGFEAQMESGIIYGLTAALYGEISIEDGAVEQSNFHDYQPMRMNDAPEIDVKIISSDAPIGGAGEPGTPPIAPAVANAVFKATGKRIRQLPLSKHEFGAAT
ncbi:xanthine dehydrogenase family protein molybdopterin-binding subunit [Hellea balneolensis]|uniref:xanthine dehydrogenase family protein molybdopterin-binding subunit n=1 Tax=Hellea balneolensis TaxID=287478 RepID=UPI0004209FC0|nr:molybdopterin cofactor-binding domain-containing protein [Hellea balneolensis]